jgi:hypothetical protein
MRTFVCCVHDDDNNAKVKGNCTWAFRTKLFLEERENNAHWENTYIKIHLLIHKKTPWPESASELYRPSDRRLSAKLMPTFVDRGCHVVSLTDPYAVLSVFYTGAATFFFKQLLSCTHEAEWTPFQTHYFSESLVAPGIELGPLDLYPGTLTTRPQRRICQFSDDNNQLV